ncbi:MAG: cytochrome b N-terminal domain-containing protein [Rhodospirillales bacterium]|nr:cytochrome b N-terminal domain-containing protein [Rhodospirillales bacterium]MDE2318129.1 cytochrome b N-terminal domain-containing protein [Rhodospirillales bacterium]
MQMEAKQGWLASRVPGLGCVCGLMKEGRAPGVCWIAALPALLGALLAVLLASGAVITVYYNPWHAYASLQGITREVRGGWLVLSYHQVGASLAFALLYLHLFRILLVRGYRAPAEFAWMLWVKLLALLLLTGWLGFVLNGGEGGYSSLFNTSNAATTLSGFPGAVAMWFLGGQPGGSTLARLLVFHVLLALCAVWVILMARAAARKARPMLQGRVVPFWPVYAAQYFAALSALALLFALLLGFAPHWGQGTQNAIPAAAMAVPSISYPWYLTPLAGLAGVFPSVTGHIWAVVAAVALLYALPWLDRSKGAPPGRVYKLLTWLLALDVLALGLFTACPIGPMLPELLTFWFFFHFLVLTPLVTMMEAA